jgi:hypothetical protein
VKDNLRRESREIERGRGKKGSEERERKGVEE